MPQTKTAASGALRTQPTLAFLVVVAVTSVLSVRAATSTTPADASAHSRLGPGQFDGSRLTSSTPASSVFGVFVGSTPCDGAIRPLLGIPAAADAHLIEWSLTLYQDARTHAPTTFDLQYKYGVTVPNRPGLGPSATTAERTGQWRFVTGANDKARARIYDLDGSLSLIEISQTVLHVLNRDRSLMIGNGGWSYTLNRRDAAEARVDPLLTASEPDQPRTISPVARGTSVLGVFEGRSPCQGIARALDITTHAGCAKVKWRVTLFQDPTTRDPTTYKIESSLHRSGARTGRWIIARGSSVDPNASLYRLEPFHSEAAMVLSRGDGNVLFVADHTGVPLTGHAEFSYTLNRRAD